MAGQNKKALPDDSPGSAISANGIQSKAVSEDTKIVSQERKVFLALLGRPLTMLMVSILVGVRRANICRLIDKWRKQGKVRLVKIDYCQISNFKAGYYSTDMAKTGRIKHPKKKKGG